MSLIDELEKVIAQEQQAQRADSEQLGDRPDQAEQGLLASLAASFREWKASMDRRPRG